MNREELEDLKITKISEEEYECLKDSDEAMEVSIDSLTREAKRVSIIT